jgi:uncharacterized membrane protein YeaQ/YmgE (transglycosylase-associated protein family)
MLMVPDATIANRLKVSAFMRSNFATSADGRPIKRLTGRRRMDTMLRAANMDDDGSVIRPSSTSVGSEDEEECELERILPEQLFLELHLNMQEKIREDNKSGISPCNAFLKQWDVSLVGKDDTVIWNARRELVDRIEKILEVAQSRIGDLKQLPGASAGVELFRNFIVDILGRETYVGKCFDYKSESYFRLARVITWELKFLAVLVTLIFNYWCFTSCVVYGAIKGQVWMENWTLLSCFCLLFLVVVDMTVEALMVGFVLPTQIMPNVRLAQVMIKRSMAAQTKIAFHDTLVNSKTADAVRFSASDYLFVSTLMAREMTHLPEANLVLGYSDPLPHAANVVKRSAGLCPSKTDVIELLLARVSLSSLLLYIASFPVFAQRAIVTAPLPIIGSFVTGACILFVSVGKTHPWPFFIVLSFLGGMMVLYCWKLISEYRQNDKVGDGDDIELIDGKPRKVDYSDSNVMAQDDHFQKLLAMKTSTQRGTTRGTQRGTHVASVMAKAPTGLAPAPRRASVQVHVKPWPAHVEEGNEAPLCPSSSSASSDNENHDVVSGTVATAAIPVMDRRVEEPADPLAAAALAVRPSAEEKRATVRRTSNVLFYMQENAQQAEAMLMDCMQARRRQSVVCMEERLEERLKKVAISVPEPVAEGDGDDDDDDHEEYDRVVKITQKRRAKRFKQIQSVAGSDSEYDDVLDSYPAAAPVSEPVDDNEEGVCGSNVEEDVLVTKTSTKKVKRVERGFTNPKKGGRGKKATKKKKVISKLLVLRPSARNASFVRTTAVTLTSAPSGKPKLKKMKKTRRRKSGKRGC